MKKNQKLFSPAAVRTPDSAIMVPAVHPRQNGSVFPKKNDTGFAFLKIECILQKNFGSVQKKDIERKSVKNGRENAN